jgi:hypothetical protein
MALRRRAHGCAHRADGTPKTESRELYEVKSWAREPRALALQEGSRGKIAGRRGEPVEPLTNGPRWPLVGARMDALLRRRDSEDGEPWTLRRKVLGIANPVRRPSRKARGGKIAGRRGEPVEPLTNGPRWPFVGVRMDALLRRRDSEDGEPWTLRRKVLGIANPERWPSRKARGGKLRGGVVSLSNH